MQNPPPRNGKRQSQRCVMHFLFVHLVLRSGISMICLPEHSHLFHELVAACSYNMESGDKDAQRQSLHTTAAVATMRRRSAAAASRAGRFLTKMIHNAIGCDALTENKILRYQYHDIESRRGT